MFHGLELSIAGLVVLGLLLDLGVATVVEAVQVILVELVLTRVLVWLKLVDPCRSTLTQVLVV